MENQQDKAMTAEEQLLSRLTHRQKPTRSRKRFHVKDADKVFLQFSIPEFPPRILPPYEGCTQAQVDAFKSDLRKALPRWFE